MEVIVTKHALERILGCGINRETIVEILKNPDIVEFSFEGRKIASKKLDFIWYIVFVEEHDKTIVLTAYHG